MHCKICDMNETDNPDAICIKCNEKITDGEITQCVDCGQWKNNRLPRCHDCWLKFKNSSESLIDISKEDPSLTMGDEIYKGLNSDEEMVAKFLIDVGIPIVHEPPVYLIDESYKHRMWFPSFLLQGFGVYIDVLKKDQSKREYELKKNLYKLNNVDIIFVDTGVESQKWKLFLLRNILRIEHYRLNILFSSMFDKITIDKDTSTIDEKNSVELTQENDYETKRGRERKIDYQKWLEELRLKYPNAYMSWTESDNNRLKKDFYQGKSIKELSHIFGRKPSAIRSRLRKNGLIED